MPKIKARQKHRIAESVDKAAAAGGRLKKAYLRSKEAATSLMDDGQTAPDEYAENRVQYFAEAITNDVGYTTISRGKSVVRRGYDAVHNRREVSEKAEKNTDIPASQVLPKEMGPSEAPFQAKAQNSGMFHYAYDSQHAPSENTHRIPNYRNSPVISLHGSQEMTKEKILPISESEGEKITAYTARPIQPTARTDTPSGYSRRYVSDVPYENLPHQEEVAPQEKPKRRIRQVLQSERQKAKQKQPEPLPDLASTGQRRKPTVMQTKDRTKAIRIGRNRQEVRSMPHPEDETVPKDIPVGKVCSDENPTIATTAGSGRRPKSKTARATALEPATAEVPEAPAQRTPVQTSSMKRSGARAQIPLSENRTGETRDLPRSGMLKDSATMRHKLLDRPAGNGISKTEPIELGKKPIRSPGIKTVQRQRRAAQNAVKTAEQSAKKAIKTSQAAMKAAQITTAQAAAITTQKTAQAAWASARTAAAAKAAVKAAAETAKAIMAGVKEMVAAIAAGGWVVVVTITIILLIGAILASPFGIFFSGNSRDNGAVSVSAAVAQINFDFNSRLEALQSGDYDGIDVSGAIADWPEMLSVFAVKVAGSEDVDAADVATMDPDRIDKLKTVFWDMNAISSEIETIDYPDSDPEDEIDDSWSESFLHITISAKTAEEMKSQYRFSEKQTAVLEELLENRDALLELVGDLRYISADAAEIMRSLSDDLSAERREVVKTACSLVGKVNYFWGGKSLVLGWDSRWGSVQKVWAEDSPTTGTYRPYGLDCSGFIDWVFFNSSKGTCVLGQGGGAAAQHSYCAPISWDEARPGDLVFYPNDDHAGIVGGRDENGDLRIIHCDGGANGVVITGIVGFTAIGRPRYYDPYE